MYVYNLALRFETIAERHADRVALWFGESSGITYEALNRLSNQIARLLLYRGVRLGDVVTITGKKSIHTFASILACLKIGAAYSLLDPDSPIERVRKIFATCKPRLFLADPDLGGQSLSFPERVEVLFLRPVDGEGVETMAGAYDEGNLPETRHITGETPAYVMYTSGSTGFPKGALMTHANVLNLIEWSTETYGITPDDILTNLNPLYFDNSVFDFYSSLFSGAQLVPFTRAEVRNPGVLVEKIDAAGCSLWFSVPSLLIYLQTMKATDGRYLRSIRRFVFGGEGYPKAKLKNLYDVYSDTAAFFNVYGPTECTCICSSYELSAQDFDDLKGFPPLGYIANNFSFLILGEDGRRVPDGETGELCLLGPNVGKGYYNDPETTAGRFMQNPYNDRYAELAYKTGDLVRLSPEDGKLYILGRKDNQVKHMGYRIELEEIESALNCLDYISEAAALNGQVDGTSRIIAVITMSGEHVEREVRHDLKRFLPSYMIPSSIFYEEVLPKNANGKVDRKKLAQKYLQLETRLVP